MDRHTLHRHISLTITTPTHYPRNNSVCEIFYELKGGRVTYGKGHSHRYGHESEGEEEHAGLYPEVNLIICRSFSLVVR